MKIIVSVLLILMSILLIVCTQEESTEPSSKDDYIPEAVVTIGSDGGSIVIENFSLNIPAGAFDAAYEISVYTSSDEKAFGDNSATRLFAIQGLPEAYSKSLRLALKYDGAISGESYIGFGKLAKDIVTGDSSVVYSLIAANDSSGYLVCTLDPQEDLANALYKTMAYQNENGGWNPWRVVFMEGFWGFKKDSTEHFKIYMPSYLQSRMEDVKTILEDCYDIITGNVELSLIDPDWEWPIRVSFRNMKNEELEVTYNINEDKKEVYFNVSYILIESSSQLPELKNIIGNKLFQLCLEGYSDMYDQDYRWISFAALTWADELFSDISSYKAPSEFPGNEMVPFQGMKTGVGNTLHTAGNHGKGMSAMIKYLVEDPRYGYSGLGNTIKSLSTMSSVEALVTNINALPADWWPDFFEQYVGGNIYQVSSSVFTKSDNLSGSWNIKDDSDIFKTFKSNDVGSYPNLSAKLFLGNLNHTTINTSANLLIDVEGEVTDDALTSIAYKLTNNGLEYLGHANASIADLEIQGLRNYIDQGLHQFVIAIVNSNLYPPFTGTSDIDLTLRVGETLPELDFNTCYIEVHVPGQYNYVSPDTTYTQDSDINLGAVYRGSFSENTFSASYLEVGESLRKTGSIEAILNDSHTEIVSFDWSEQWVALPGPRYTKSKALSAQNIPLSYFSSRMVFGISGETVTDHIITLRDELTSTDGLNYVIQNFWSYADSFIKVEFYTSDP